MSTRSLLTRLDRLSKLTHGRELCIHHGGLCRVGTRPLPDFYVMVIDAKRRAGQDVPPLDVHRAMTLTELQQHDADMAVRIAAAEAENARILADMDAEQEAQRVVDEVAWRLPGGPQ